MWATTLFSGVTYPAVPYALDPGDEDTSRSFWALLENCGFNEMSSSRPSVTYEHFLGG